MRPGVRRVGQPGGWGARGCAARLMADEKTGEHVVFMRVPEGLCRRVWRNLWGFAPCQRRDGRGHGPMRCRRQRADFSGRGA